MGVPVGFQSSPQGLWRAARPYRARKRLRFTVLMSLLGIVMFFLVGELLLLLDMFPSYTSYSDLGVDAYCFSVLAGLAIILGFGAIRYYRHILALGLVDESVYRIFTVFSKGKMVEVTDNALKALHMDYSRYDPPAPAYTNTRRFPKDLMAMFSVRDQGLSIVVYTGSIKGDTSFISDVIVGPVHPNNTTVVGSILKAIDDGKEMVRPPLNIRTA